MSTFAPPPALTGTVPTTSLSRLTTKAVNALADTVGRPLWFALAGPIFLRRLEMKHEPAPLMTVCKPLQPQLVILWKPAQQLHSALSWCPKRHNHRSWYCLGANSHTLKGGPHTKS
ncbi:unnamed protein product [Polarella glacialis]|uniref:Uncharacterized protein n=1 Tax=Polarella glacialis TaxID=89957 RepID=A0A813E651_POLGL|nr:unnamed protein product [Polarella glacialis]